MPSTPPCIAAVLAGHPVRPQGGNYLVCCPVHEDRNPSLSLRDGDDGRLLAHCFAGCDPLDVLAEIRSRIGRREYQGNGFAVALVNSRPVPAARDPADVQPPSAPTRSKALVVHLAVVHRPARNACRGGILNGRGLDLPGRSARSCTAVPSVVPLWAHRAVPALIAAFHPDHRSPTTTRRLVAIMRVGLDADGTKIAKGMMLGPVARSAIKLDPDENVNHME